MNNHMTENYQYASSARQGMLKGIILLVVAIILWGCNWPVMKAGLSHITPLWFSTLRFSSSAAVLFLLQLSIERIRIPGRRELPVIFSVGLLQMMAFTALGCIAMNYLPAGKSAVLAYTTPLWVVPASVFLFKEKLSSLQLSGALIGIIGIVVLFNPIALDWHDHGQIIANGLLLLASLCWAICILHLRHTGSRLNAFELAPWQMLLATLVLLPLAWGFEGNWSGDNSRELLAITLFVGPVATAFCFCAVNAASTWLSGVTLSSMMLLVPITGLLVSVPALHEELTLPLMAGALLIALGIALLTRKKA
ncbi:EamA family transporter (plasmid) [Pantoea phytobeneficialis]|uniref:Threonine/homoserine exporter RhtA n=2 Tax=Pantoea phytobeneficialis TaxID=2052056 RepID=A0AAP9HAY0_9GAMM|nr:EamA family transporter [Pantoea phytobeneficialis]